MRKSIGAALAIAVLLIIPVLVAQEKEYAPSVGQEGKDVIWVPTPEELVQAMLDLAKVTPQDYVMDLGSGDGRIVMAAAKRGARATGVEYNPDMVELSRRNAEKAGLSGKASFVNADLFATDLSQANVITMYLLPSLNLKLRPTILSLKPGTRIVAHAFNMGEWQCDQSVEREGRTAYMWIVPAQVAGDWTFHSDNGNSELHLNQTFQMIEGTMKRNGKEVEIRNAKVEGSRIAFNCGDEEYSGEVNGRQIEGTVKTRGHEHKWSATIK